MRYHGAMIVRDAAGRRPDWWLSLPAAPRPARPVSRGWRERGSPPPLPPNSDDDRRDVRHGVVGVDAVEKRRQPARHRPRGGNAGQRPEHGQGQPDVTTPTRMAPGDAPSAIRTAVSFRRCRTWNAEDTVDARDGQQHGDDRQERKQAHPQSRHERRGDQSFAHRSHVTKRHARDRCPARPRQAPVRAVWRLAPPTPRTATATRHSARTARKRWGRSRPRRLARTGTSPTTPTMLVHGADASQSPPLNCTPMGSRPAKCWSTNDRLTTATRGVVARSPRVKPRPRRMASRGRRSTTG